MTGRRDQRSSRRPEMVSRRAPAYPNGRAPATRSRQPAPSRGFRLSPGVIILAIAVVFSVVFAIYALTVRDTSQIPLLAAGAVVVGLAFGALALYTLSAVWRAGIEGRGGRAILLGLFGGGAAMVAAGCLAGAVILFLLAGSS